MENFTSSAMIFYGQQLEALPFLSTPENVLIIYRSLKTMQWNSNKADKKSPRDRNVKMCFYKQTPRQNLCYKDHLVLLCSASVCGCCEAFGMTLPKHTDSELSVQTSRGS